MLLKISIHASTRGATINRRECRAVHAISIHASTRGATGKAGTDVSDMLFQSTLPREERRISTSQTKLLQNFNPRFHERSDKLELGTAKEEFKFQSTLPREERPCAVLFQVPLSLVFQSTLPREERRVLLLLWLSVIFNFNPRFHERSDSDWRQTFNGYDISIHASTRGATESEPNNRLLYNYFNPRFHERSDCA